MYQSQDITAKLCSSSSRRSLTQASSTPATALKPPSSPASLVDGQAQKGGLLVGVGNASRRGQVLRPLIVREFRDDAVDLASEVRAWHAVGDAPEVGWDDGPPIDSYLPRARFVSEEDHAVGIRVDTPEQRE